MSGTRDPWTRVSPRVDAMSRGVRRQRVAARLTRRAAAASVVLVLGVAMAACSEPSDPAPEAAKPTPLAEFDGTTTQVRRASFCTLVPDAAAAAAVGKVTATHHYGNGEQVPGVQDVAHEYGCVFDGADGLVARAWVFVPPVTPAQAAGYAAKALQAPGCTPLDAGRFGASPVGTLCRTPEAVTATYRGLFGDAWLSCSLSAPPAAGIPDATLAERAGSWCVQVARTATA